MPKKVGIMVPLFSLEGNQGIGDIDSLYQLVDRLRGLGIQILQLLPLNALAKGDSSPYSSISAFANHAVYISLGRLKHLKSPVQTLSKVQRVDYSKAFSLKEAVLREDFEGFSSGSFPLERKRFLSFCEKQAQWLEPFALFNSLSLAFEKAWWDWDAGLQTLEGAKDFALSNASEIEFHKYLQWVFYQQWMDLKTYAGEAGIQFMGDLPLYVSRNSCDRWAHPELFRKKVRAGVPPDLYSKEGQDWGNPIYDWKVMRKSDFSWWKSRLDWLGEFFDLVRIDHIRGLYSYFAVPDGKKPKDIKRWTPGPGTDLIKVLQQSSVDLVGEDLGSIPPRVDDWMQEIQVPGYRVFLFGWGEYKSQKYRFPENYPENTLACTSTHDSESYFEFLEGLKESEVYELAAYLDIQAKEEFTLEDLRVRTLQKLLDCPSRFVVFPLQDILGKSLRLNYPGSVSDDNWTGIIPVGEKEQKSLNEFGKMIAAIKSPVSSRTQTAGLTSRLRAKRAD
jgi:4-alpha-glucanotransferase